MGRRRRLTQKTNEQQYDREGSVVEHVRFLFHAVSNTACDTFMQQPDANMGAGVAVMPVFRTVAYYVRGFPPQECRHMGMSAILRKSVVTHD